MRTAVSSNLRWHNHVAVAAAALTVVACGGPTITSDRDDSIPIPKAATYAWCGNQEMHPKAKEGGADPIATSTIVHQRIHNSINKTLATKGYKMVDDPTQADFCVRYYLGVKTETSYQTTTSGAGMYGPGYGYGWGGYGGGIATSTTTPIQTNVGGLLVDLVQRTSGKLAWRGVLKGDVPDEAPSQERVDKGIADVMATLPAAT
jgi:hypothetical protein